MTMRTPAAAYHPVFPPIAERAAAPHCVQNREPGTSGAEQREHWASARGAPHSGQNLPVESAPHDGHFMGVKLPERQRVRPVFAGHTFATKHGTAWSFDEAG